jgi:glutamate racemase
LIYRIPGRTCNGKTMDFFLIEAYTQSTMLGIFDSGFGGLTVLKPIHDHLPNLSTIYLGDNARAPYGVHDHETIFKYTLEGIRFLFEKGCPLVILACNTASAQALRHIQQDILPKEYPDKRVLGVIRPAAEQIATMSETGHVGIFATRATVYSNTYIYEILHQNSKLKIAQISCPGITDLIEAGKHQAPEMKQIINIYTQKMLEQNPHIDAVLLACTHFPLVKTLFQQALPKSIKVISQGEIVARELAKYLEHHPEISEKIDMSGSREYFTTGSLNEVTDLASLFYGKEIEFERVEI